ncbi:MAG: PAS domain S-box protein [Candidatus Desulforudis sp.]|nr:PAS domain S-box protein [Desulforudis sp.]
MGEVTELNRRTTRSLSQTSDFLQTVLDALPAGVFLQDRAGRITSVNRYLHQLLGGSRAEALAEDRGTHDSARNNLETIRALAGDPKSPVQVGEIKKPDGESVPVQVSRHPVALDGEAQVILVQDLSDQQKLRELDLMLHRLLEGWDIGVIFLDAADRVRIHNEAARRYLQFDDNINGRSGVDILQRLGLKAPGRDRKPAGGMETVLNDRYLLVDRAIWHKSPDGRPWTVLTIHDITERKKAELEIQRARNLSSLGQIAAGVAHELRNPLTSIKGFAQLALEQKDLEKSKKHTEVVLRQTSHMQEILDRFLFMAKPSQPSYQVADLREIVLWVWELLYNESLHREVRLEKKLPPEALTVRVDPQLMRQVILNLVNNAFDATPPGGSVRLEAGAAGHEVHLTVTDTGSGIPAHQLDEVFVPFFTTKEKGSGLGLAISHELVRKHGGTLSVESSGSGTSFRIVLPRLDPGPPAENLQPHAV